MTLVRDLALVLALCGASGCARGASDDATATGTTGGHAGVAMPQREPAGEGPRQPPTSSADAGRVEAANEVERYGDETPLGFVQATVVQSAIAHTAPKDGREVTLLVGGTGVAQVAVHGDAILLSFSDPANEACVPAGTPAEYAGRITDLSYCVAR